MHFSSPGEGAESAHRGIREAPGTGQGMKWELAAAGDEIQRRVRFWRISPSLSRVTSSLATFHILLEEEVEKCWHTRMTTIPSMNTAQGLPTPREINGNIFHP